MGDQATVATAFALSHGVFTCVFPLAPASATCIELAMVVLCTGVLATAFGCAAIALGVAFEAAGILAILAPAGVYAVIALSVVQVLWIVAAGVTFGLSGR